MRHVPLLTLLAACATTLSACATDPAPEATSSGATLAGRGAASFLAEGERLWRASCPVPGEGDLCVTRVAATAPGHCGSPPASRLVVTPREPEQREAARAALGQAARLGKQVPTTPAAARAAARAFYLLGEDAAESLFADDFPDGLDFAPANAAASQVRFRTFIEDATADLINAKAVYLEVVDLSAAEAVAAALRVAQLYERYARLVAFGSVPADVAPYADAVTAYCDALAEESAKLLAKADEARAYCRRTWQALPEGSRPPQDPCGAELEPRADLAAHRPSSE
jgi:hypothetical protein